MCSSFSDYFGFEFAIKIHNAINEFNKLEKIIKDEKWIRIEQIFTYDVGAFTKVALKRQNDDNEEDNFSSDL